MQTLVITLYRAWFTRGLHINLEKWKIEVMGKTKRAQDMSVSVRINGRRRRQVQIYKYLKCFVWSLLLYGCEAWMLDKTRKSRDVVPENDRVTMDCKNNERKGDWNGGGKGGKEEAAEVSWAPTEAWISRKRSASWKIRENESQRKNRGSYLVRVSLRIFLERQRWPDWCGWRKVRRGDVPWSPTSIKKRHIGMVG